MAKKKVNSSVVYTPIGEVSNIPSIIEQKINQIPPYNDSGITYEGKYKIQKTADTYELKGQQTRFIACNLQNYAAGSVVLFARANATSKFYCTHILVDYKDMSTFGSSNYFQVADVKLGSSNNPLRFVFFPTDTTGHLFIDLSHSPRLFQQDYVAIVVPHNMGVNEFIVFSLFGWEEQP